MDFHQKIVLGSSGLEVGRLGVAAGYGAPAEALLEAFEQGCNYFYWGSFRSNNMRDAIRDICKRGLRDQLVVVLQIYNRIASMMTFSVERGLKKAGIDYADVLLLGWHSALPAPRILDTVAKIKERGLVKKLAISGHSRRAFPIVAERKIFDIFHIRYNAAHRGAETEVFPKLPKESRPGVVIYTATRWGQLLDPKYMPPGEKTPQGADCYRFVLSTPGVDVCMTGPRDAAQMQEALRALELGPMSEEELAWMRRIGAHVRKQRRNFPF